MSGEITATSWNTRHFDPNVYGSEGNHACLWDIAREQLAREGYKEMPAQQIQAKVNVIVAFHNQQTDLPGFRKINNPDVIGDGQVIFVPPDGKTLKTETRLDVGEGVSSPDGNTVLSIETVNNEHGKPVAKLFVNRDDGQGFTRVELPFGGGVKRLEVTKDGTVEVVDRDDKKHILGKGRLVIQNDGNVVLYGDNGPLWESKTERR